MKFLIFLVLTFAILACGKQQREEPKPWFEPSLFDIGRSSSLSATDMENLMGLWESDVTPPDTSDFSVQARMRFESWTVTGSTRCLFKGRDYGRVTVEVKAENYSGFSGPGSLKINESKSQTKWYDVEGWPKKAPCEIELWYGWISTKVSRGELVLGGLRFHKIAN